MSEQARHSSQTDALSGLLAQFGLRAGVFFSGDFCGTAEYAGGAGTGHLHLLRRGSLLLKSSGQGPVLVAQPSLILMVDAGSHLIETDTNGRAELVCATLDFEGARNNPLLLGLPDLMIIPLDALQGLEATLELLFAEAFARRAGHGATVDRLVEVLIIMVLRHSLEKGHVSTGFLAGIAEPRIARSLQAMHASPADDWNVERLAETANMSRASFAALFKECVGVAPGDYLTMLRVTKAQRALLSGKHLKAVAALVGYRSPTAFARVFQRRVGCSPRDWLRSTQQL